MHMLRERLQLLVTRDQRRRLEAEAERRRTSVGAVIRDAIEERLSGADPEERLRALAEIRAMGGGRYLAPDALDRIVGEERERLIAGPRRRR